MKIPRWLDDFYDAALALGYPQTCDLCGCSVERRADAPLCADCWETLVPLTGGAVCWKCGAPALTSLSATPPPRGIFCRRCDDHFYTAARAAGRYEGALRSVVLDLKRRPHVPARLKSLLVTIQQTPPLDAATLIIPVPLHPVRERERGFNQARALAEAVAAETRLPLDLGNLIRTAHDERHRAGLDARGRRDSVRDAFTVRRPRLIEGERVLLIDDVLTTGATASACAAALRQAGAGVVFVLTIARV